MAHTQKPIIDTNYCRGTMRYQDVRMGDFKDGLQRWTVGAHEQWRQIDENFISRSSTTCTLINFEKRTQRVLQELEGRHWVAEAFSVN